jgi:hypothetical protein
MHPKKSAGKELASPFGAGHSHSVSIPQPVPELVIPGDGVSATKEFDAYAVLVDILSRTDNTSISDRGPLQTVTPLGQPSARVPQTASSVASDPFTSDGEPRDENATLESRGLRIVADSLVVAEHCLSGTTTSSSDASIRELIRLTMTRAAALLQVLRFLKNDYTPVRMGVAVGAVARRVSSLASFEQRLRGISIVTTTRGDDAHIDADEGLLSNVLLTLLWTFESLHDVNDPRVTLTVAPDEDGRSGVSFVLTQGHVAPAQNWSLYSGGADARVLRSVGTLAASQIAHLWGGHFTASTGGDLPTFSLYLPLLRLS